MLRQDIQSNQVWDGTSSSCNNDYENSDIKIWLNNTFLNTIDEKIRAEIKTVKIPFKKGNGNSSSGVYSGSNGLSCKVFLLSGYEVGFTQSNDKYFPIDGAKLDYFSDNASRVAKLNGSAAFWWLRSPLTSDDKNTSLVGADGSCSGDIAYSSYGVRPAFILPSSLSISLFNTLPTITSDKQGDLGKLDSGFTCQYSADYDDEGDITVTLNLDGKQLNTFTAVKQQEYTFSLEGLEWRKVLNGEHSFTINVSDGAVTTTREITFSKDCNRVAFELETPMPADDVISVCSVKIKGGVTTDTLLKCEVTNNANDTTPVWEDCTAKVKSEMVYLFKNKTAENGFAFNLRISAQRGASGAKGYITSVEGGFG